MLSHYVFLGVIATKKSA